MSTPKLSVIVICYNMQRELPRTLFTLSCDYQKNIDLSDYEIIVIDNGSKNKPLQEGFNADMIIENIVCQFLYIQNFINLN